MSSAASVSSGVAAGSRAVARVDLSAVQANIRTLQSVLEPRVPLMAVLKADAYGHGLQAIAEAAGDVGVTDFGVATLGEALALRPIRPTDRILAWLWTDGDPIAAALAAGIEVAVSTRQQLSAVLAATADADVRPRLHLKVDTGLGRNGAGPAERTELIGDLVSARERVHLVGVMSHLAGADLPGDPSVARQTVEFHRVRAEVEAAGLGRPTGHLANTAGLLEHPETHGDLVRAGIGLYGLNPVGPTTLRPAMTLAATIANLKRVPADYGVSYGLTYRTARETTLALVPLGYGDGIPRIASNIGEVAVHGRRYRIAGRVAMDQFVIDVGGDPIQIGDEATIFGPGDAGEPTAREWADWCGTIDYEIVTRLGPRVPRAYHRTGC